MPRRRLRRFRVLVGEKLAAAFDEDLPPRDVAATFALGLFVAALPNWGRRCCCSRCWPTTPTTSAGSRWSPPSS